jgi:hypothetical protein
VCSAQFSSNLQGVVLDPSGRGIPKATVKLLNTGTQVSDTTTTNGSGDYRFVSLAPGQYQLTAEAPGFANATVTVTLQTSQTLNVPITVAVAATTQTVEVTGQAPTLNTAESRNQLTLEEQALLTLPLAGRNVISLVTLAPGVTGLGTVAGGSPGSAVDNFSTETQVDASANGRGSVGNMYIVDGLDVTSDIRPGVLNLTPNPDSIDETTIQTNTFSVEYGRASSIQMVMTTKSGTDTFHGNASDYFTYQNLWAGTEFVHQYAPFHSNNFSGTLGGPLVPHHQAFFFVSVEPLRASASTGNSITTFEDPQFTAFARQQFPDTLGTKLLTSYAPTGATVTGISQRASDIFPGTCGTSATAFIPCSLPMVDTGVFNSTNYRNGLQFNTRIDKYFANDRVYGNFYRTSLDTGGGAIRPAFATTNHYITDSLQLNETHTFSPNTLNEAEFAFLRVEGISPQTGNFSVPVVSVVGQGVGFGDGFALGDFIQHNYHWRDVLTHIRGSHSLKFGYEGWHGDDLALFAPAYAQPNFVFNNLLDLVQDQPYSESSLAYNPLTGQPAKGQYEYALTTAGAFVEDTWRVRRNVTLNYGLRWDDFGNPYPLNGTVLANYHMGPGLTPEEQVANGFMLQQDHVFNHALANVFSPRAGVAWDPNGKGVWAVRGGFGVFHDWPTLGNDENGLKGNPPGWIVPVFLSGTTTAPVFAPGTSNTYPFGFPYPPFTATQLDSHGGLVGRQLSVGGIDPNLIAPTTYSYTTTVERRLPKDLVASIGYAGSYSTNLITGSGQQTATSYGFDINRFSGDLITNNNVLTRLNPSFGSIDYAQNGAEGTYNALIVAVRGRFGQRGFFSASYTRSRSYDDTQVYPLATNIHQYYGPSVWNAPNRFSLTWSYELPGLQQGHGFVGRVTSGWTVSGTTILQSGLPFNVYTTAPFQPILDAQGKVIGMKPGSGDYNADGFNFDFPNVSSYSIPTSRQAYLNGLFTASAFGIPTLGTEGNEQFNMFPGPGFAETDAALLKETSLTERWKLQLRFEFYNIFNRPNLNGVDSNLPDGTFGRSVAQFNPRWLQFGINLMF